MGFSSVPLRGSHLQPFLARPRCSTSEPVYWRVTNRPLVNFLWPCWWLDRQLAHFRNIWQERDVYHLNDRISWRLVWTQKSWRWSSSTLHTVGQTNCWTEDLDPKGSPFFHRIVRLQELFLIFDYVKTFKALILIAGSTIPFWNLMRHILLFQDSTRNPSG